MVKVKLTLNADGSIQNPEVYFEAPQGLGLGKITLEGIGRCHLKPVIKDGVPIAATKHLQFVFSFE